MVTYRKKCGSNPYKEKYKFLTCFLSRTSVLMIGILFTVVAVLSISSIQPSAVVALKGLKEVKPIPYHNAIDKTSIPPLPPLSPQLSVIGETKIYWMLPEQHIKTKGILVYFHGCNGEGANFFVQPEERIVAHSALLRGLATVSIESFNRKSGCWGEKDAELLREQNTIVEWKKIAGLTGNFPTVALGASSGGSFLFRAWKVTPFDAIAPYITSTGFTTDDISRGNSGGKEEFPLPAVIYVQMPRDEKKVIIINNNANIMKKEKIPVEVIEVNPHPFTQALCAHRIPEMGNSKCKKFIEMIHSEFPQLLDKKDETVQRWKSSDWKRALKKANLGNNGESDIGENLPQQSFKGYSWLYAGVNEEINAAFGMHEMVADQIEKVLDFLMNHANMG